MKIRSPGRARIILKRRRESRKRSPSPLQVRAASLRTLSEVETKKVREDQTPHSREVAAARVLTKTPNSRKSPSVVVVVVIKLHLSIEINRVALEEGVLLS